MNYNSLKTINSRYARQVDIKRPDTEDDSSFTDVYIDVTATVIPNRNRQQILPNGEVITKPEFTCYLSPLGGIQDGDVIFRSGYDAADRLFVNNVFHIDGDDIMILDLDSTLK